jgi:hypothetical protein
VEVFDPTSKVKVTLRLTVSCQLVLVSSPIWGPRPNIYYCVTVTVLFLWGALSDERTGPSFFYVQSFSGPSPLGLATIFYCLRFETSLFVASYDSQGHGGGSRPRLHTGLYILSKSKSKLYYDRRSAGQSVLEQSTHFGLTTRS